jgi:arylsulfatase A-like enzyme
MNVLYITVDALRVDHVRDNIMPFTRSFFNDHIEFTECVANGPGTPWSFPALLASRYAASTKGFGIPSSDDQHPTLAEVLSRKGFSTGGFTDNRFASSAYNYDRGIDYMYDGTATSFLKSLKQSLRENLNQDGILFQSLLKSYHLVDDLIVKASDRDSRFIRSEHLVDSLLEWTISQQNWFAWIHPMDVHAPYEAPDQYQQKYLDEPVGRVRSQKLARAAVHHPNELTIEDWRLQKRLYKAECRYLDSQIRRLFNSLSRRGELEDTIVVFTADHGDMHGEHGRGGHPQEFWEEIIRVPFALSLPEEISATVDGQVCLVDLPPTVLSAIGIDTPNQWEGQSVLEWIDHDSPPRELAYINVGAEQDHQHAGLRREDGWKLLRHRDKEYLFNLSENPEENEQKNLISEEPAIYKRLAGELDDHLDKMEQRRARGKRAVENEEMIEDHLQELGYLE